MTLRGKVLSIVLVAALAPAVAYLTWLESSDTSTYYEYATYNDLKQSQTPAAAVVPELVPSSAKRIWGWYNVEMNVSALEFELSREDRASIVRAFQRVDGSEQQVIERKVGSYEWEHEVPHGTGIETFSGRQEGTEYLILDTENWRAYYVSEP
jgi:hypothetical protein